MGKSVLKKDSPRKVDGSGVNRPLWHPYQDRPFSPLDSTPFLWQFIQIYFHFRSFKG